MVSSDNQPDRLVALAEHAGFRRVTITAPPLTHATGTVVRLIADDTHLIGKIHRAPTRHDQEVRSYREWAPHLAGRTPELLASDPRLPGILLTTVAGTPLDELALPAGEEQAAFQQAGHLLAALHQIPVTGDPARITGQLAERAEYWITELGGYLTSRQARLIRDHMRELTNLTTVRVTACHLDFQPRNLLWHPDHGLHLIDFEHARVDLAARDLVRLATRYWSDRPDLRAAFLDGYGPISASDTAALHHCTALDAATTLAYGIRHAATALITRAHTLLDTLDPRHCR